MTAPTQPPADGSDDGGRAVMERDGSKGGTELLAIKTAYDAISKLDHDAQSRAMTWLQDRLGTDRATDRAVEIDRANRLKRAKGATP